MDGIENTYMLEMINEKSKDLATQDDENNSEASMTNTALLSYCQFIYHMARKSHEVNLEMKLN